MKHLFWTPVTTRHCLENWHFLHMLYYLENKAKSSMWFKFGAVPAMFSFSQKSLTPIFHWALQFCVHADILNDEVQVNLLEQWNFLGEIFITIAQHLVLSLNAIFLLFFYSFMASVLTAVLQYHLAWVSTVMPAGAAPSRAYLDKHSSKTVSYFLWNFFVCNCPLTFIFIEISR